MSKAPEKLQPVNPSDHSLLNKYNLCADVRMTTLPRAVLSFAGLLSSKEGFPAPKRSTGSVCKMGHHHTWGVTDLDQDRSSDPKALQPLHTQHWVMCKIHKHRDLCLPALSTGP